MRSHADRAEGGDRETHAETGTRDVHVGRASAVARDDDAAHAHDDVAWQDIADPELDLADADASAALDGAAANADDVHAADGDRDTKANGTADAADDVDDDDGDGDGGDVRIEASGAAPSDPLDAAAPRAALPHRAQMERAFGESFAGVDARVGANLDELGAEGAARGEQVAFADASPDPDTVAHELAHVVQHRRAGGGASPAGIADANTPAEHEADAVGQRVARGEQAAHVSARPAGSIHLKRRRYARHGDAFNPTQRGGRPHVKITGGLDGGRFLNLQSPAPRYEVSQDGMRWEPLAGQELLAGTQIELNIAAPRRLPLASGGEPVECVLARVTPKKWRKRGAPTPQPEGTGDGVGWMPIAELGRAASGVRTRAKRLARKYAPRAPRSVRGLDELVFREPVGVRHHVQESLTPFDTSRPREIALRIQNRAKLGHYLDRGGRYSIQGNLPQPGTPPISNDTVHDAAGEPNTAFFAVTRRGVATYPVGRRGGAKIRTWVFGLVGKQVEGRWVADRTRRGWVPALALRKNR